MRTIDPTSIHPRTHKILWFLLMTPQILALFGLFWGAYLAGWGGEAGRQTLPFLVAFLAGVQVMALQGTIQAFRWMFQAAAPRGST